MIANTPKSLAVFIKDNRKLQNLSQSDVASNVGLRQATVSEFETRPETTSIETLLKILSSMEMELHVVPKHEQLPRIDQNLNEEDEW